MTSKKNALKKIKLRNAEYYDFQEVQDALYQQSLQGVIFKDLMSTITSEENIRLAYRNIKSNSGSLTAGTDGKTIRYYAAWSERDLIAYIRKRFSWYTAQPVKRVEIPKPNGKMRPLGIPTIADRLIQQCVLQVLEPICEAKFYEHSYGFRPNRSCENAIARAESLMQVNGLHFVVDIDIKGFFDNISHGKLLKQLWHIGIRDKKLISIISQMLKAEVAHIGFPEKGTPQGGIISPLLANVVLNELDWWISSQWETFPTKTKYAINVNKSGTPIHSARYLAQRRRSNLKEMFLVRYADDFKIFCRTHDQAKRAFIATQEWLKERLSLEISDEKSKVINLRQRYSDFLGFRLKVIQTGKTVHGKTRYGVKSKISDKAIKSIHAGALQHIEQMQRPADSQEAYATVGKWNSFVMGVHNYYCIATESVPQFGRLAFSINRTLRLRLRNNLAKTGIVQTKCILKKYGWSSTLRYAYGNAMAPLSAVSPRVPLHKKKAVNNYTAEGRSIIHKNLGCVNMAVMHYLMRNPVRGASIEFNDNRLSLYAGQQGKCFVTQTELVPGNIHCHHRTRRKDGGTDHYQNLVLVHGEIHILIHATNPDIIKRYFRMFSFTTHQLDKLNKLRKLVGNEPIYREEMSA